MKKKLFTGIILIFFAFSLSGQSVFAPLNQDYYHWLDRYEIRSSKGLFQGFHTSVKPYQRSKIAEFVKILEQDSTLTLSKADRANLAYFRQDNWEWMEQEDAGIQYDTLVRIDTLRRGDSTLQITKILTIKENPFKISNTKNIYKKPFWKNIYRQRSDFFHHQDKNFDLHLNPVIHWTFGKDSNTDKIAYLNTRGIELRGMIASKVGFYTFFTDNQASFPKYVQDRIKSFDSVPQEVYYKDGDAAEPTKVDFLHARGYLVFKVAKPITVQFGHDRNVIGNGYRSLILSDFAPNYLFLKLNTNIWKLNYQNVFAQMTARVLNADGLRPKKYMAHHHLSLNISKNFNVGIFETIIFGQRDSLTNNGFELNYLNPIIFYRSVEQQLGSPDNALLGADFKWNFARRFSLYGQFVLDEFLLREIRNNRGWWGNKFAVQVGGKYINAFGIPNLDLQGEVNLVRPYTYTQDNNFKSYTHYQQPLAHPLGANFIEYLGVVRYQPLPRLQLTGKLFLTRAGLDENGLNWGGNLLLDNRTRPQEYGNRIGQGLDTRILLADATVSYQPWHNVFLELKQVLRKVENTGSTLYKNTSFTSLGLRMNIAPRLHEF